MLTSAQVRQFQEQGYTTAPAFFSARELAALRADLERLKSAGKLRNVATEGDGKTHSSVKVNLQICPIAPHSTLIRALEFAPKVVEAVGQLVGNPFLFRLDQIFLKPAKHGAGTKWHQDAAYWKTTPDPTKGVGMWTALHDATVENGTMHIVPKSHVAIQPHQRDPDSDHHIHTIVPDERALPIELPAGGVLFFNFGILHCTKANRTDHERAGLALHFVNTDHAAPEFYSSGSITHITGPRATGGLKEYGVQVEGTWDEEVEQSLGRNLAPSTV
jgi:ectoine hydroxylase-related dioxygenase (phytanoyl-CoA dioxygenase family)